MKPTVSVSVVIPLYNAVEVIAETIRSVLAQTWLDREILVIDDGSTDGSTDVVATFGDRVRYYRFDNAGVAKSRNRGIALSQGQYVALMDHDDLWDPTKLEKQVQVLQSRPEVGLVYTGIVHLERNGRPRKKFSTGPSSRFYQLFVKGFGPTPSAAMLRRSVIDQAGGFDERFASAGLDDHEFWPRVAQHCEIALIDEPLTYHRHRELKPPQVELSHRLLLNGLLMERFGHDQAKRRYLLEERAASLADLGKWRLSQADVTGGRACLKEALALSVGEIWNVKMTWRSLSRLLRSYL
ncbi:MAG TPA: glycosyltransferase family A protein [Nitrospiraceae bacterium]|nr:glycosyltransferase family A protein [Nitrospiraceae bacterium]